MEKIKEDFYHDLHEKNRDRFLKLEARKSEIIEDRKDFVFGVITDKIFPIFYDF